MIDSLLRIHCGQRLPFSQWREFLQRDRSEQTPREDDDEVGEMPEALPDLMFVSCSGVLQLNEEFVAEHQSRVSIHQLCVLWMPTGPRLVA